MPHRLATTQEIPAWSRNLSTNAPEAWRLAIGERADALGVSAGEVMRRWMLLGAMADARALGQRMVKAHREYYPNRQMVLMAAVGLLAAGLFVQAVGGRHDVRRVRVAHRAQIHRVARWDGAAAAI